MIKANPRELNPYLKNNGDGYPDEVDVGAKEGISQLLPTSVVGDGGASWRLKALKRAQEQAAREGRQVEEVRSSISFLSSQFLFREYCNFILAIILQVVGERWGSVSELSVMSRVRAAPYRAHLHAIKNRQKGVEEESQAYSSEVKDKKDERVRYKML